jgi:hypothetical protein
MVDFNINKNNKAVANVDIECILQQIDLLFNTNKREVLGDIEFGNSYDKYLHELNVPNDVIKHKIEQDIRNLELFGFDVDVEVYFIEGTVRDIFMSKIILHKDEYYYEKIYKII